MNMRHIRYALPLPTEDHFEPRGRLLNQPAHCALWYFFRCAHVALEETPGQATLIGEADMQSDLTRLAEGIGRAAGLELSQVFEPSVIRRAYAEVKRRNMSFDPRVRAFVDSGGQVYRNFDRDQDVLNQKD